MSTFDDTNIDTNPPLIYTQYDVPQTVNESVTNIGGATTVVTTINGGGGGKASGPTITFGSNWSGINFAAAVGSVNIEITNAANARTALGAAASGTNTDITQLNGASQVDVSGEYKVSGTQVVTARQPAIPDAILGTEVATINLILAALRTHGLIAP